MSFPTCRGGKDPRFDSTIGGKPFHQDEFARRYKFLYDDVLPQERADLKKQLRVSWEPGYQPSKARNQAGVVLGNYEFGRDSTMCCRRSGQTSRSSCG